VLQLFGLHTSALSNQDKAPLAPRKTPSLCPVMCSGLSTPLTRRCPKSESSGDIAICGVFINIVVRCGKAPHRFAWSAFTSRRGTEFRAEEAALAGDKTTRF
jgi:hypothetical protein